LDREKQEFPKSFPKTSSLGSIDTVPVRSLNGRRSYWWSSGVSVDPDNGPTGPYPLAGVRTILVPPDIVAVPQRPKPPRPKKPPWRPCPDAGPTDRAGGRQWFSDRLFVEGQDVPIRSSLGASIGAHVLVIALAVVLVARFERAGIVRVHQSLVMPAMLLMPPIPDPLSGGPRSVQHSKQVAQHSEAAPAAERPTAPAPVEEPSSIEPEPTFEGSPDGIEGGVPGGAGDGPSGETASSGPGVGPSGPVRLGSTVAPPKKVKDVRPVYPPIALAMRARGTVILDVTIGTDGKVQDAKVLHSVPHLDLAALEAVRQWEYEPTRINGALVALVMTVVVNFAIQ
jgi:protein TonB